jgi:hypothetical protein
MNGRLLTVSSRSLAHCRVCHEPMYYIYDQKVRDFCYECVVEQRVHKGMLYDDIILGPEENY